jgi:hypothetical protein
MTATTSTCIEISCNLCTWTLGEDGDGIEHFPTVEYAIQARSSTDPGNWLITPDGYAICPAEDEDHDQARTELAPRLPASQIPGQQPIPEAEP